MADFPINDSVLGDEQSRDAASPERWWALAVLCLSIVVITIDTTILNVALPSLVRSLHASSSQLQWIVDAYTVVFASLLLTAGSLGDRFGRLGALNVGMAVFALGSVGSALAGSPAQLIASRGAPAPAAKPTIAEHAAVDPIPPEVVQLA